MKMAVALSPGTLLILVIFLQSTLAQQCLNNVDYKNTAGGQQTFQKASYGSKTVLQNGLNFNPPQQANTQQVNYQQQSNIQQVPFQASNLQPQINFQQGSSQQSANSISNSQLLKQQNQDLAANIFSALYNIRQSSQNQRTNNAKGNPSQQMNYEQQQVLSQNQPNPTFMVTAPVNLRQNSQPSVSNLYSESVNFQPAFTFQDVPTNNVPVQQNQQILTLPVHKVNYDQSQSYTVPDQSAPNSTPNHQTIEKQSPLVMIPSSQSNSIQSQPIVLTLQPSQIASVPNQSTPSGTQTSQSQPLIYTVQTQPTSGISQNQHNLEIPNQQQATNNLAIDKQPLMSYVMSQVQAPQGSSNALASILPPILSSKPEKSLSMKTILPLILNLLNEKKGCCGCPHCGWNNNHCNDLMAAEPIINTGYSNQINYSQQPRPVEVSAKITKQLDNSETSANTDIKTDKSKETELKNNSADNSEEEDAYESEEEYDED